MFKPKIGAFLRSSGDGVVETWRGFNGNHIRLITVITSDNLQHFCFDHLCKLY